LVAHLKGERPPGVETELQLTAVVDPLEGPEFAVRDMALAIRRRELDAITGRKRAVRLAIQRHALQASRVVRH
jgi:hypothetical protein